MSTTPGTVSPLPIAATVDSQHPWLGLASYTEEVREYFHGRDDDAAELSRRVQRKLLTVLFGQSGHGKTSLLRAGLVPRLRPEGFCPVYVRIDYDPKSPPPSEQIKLEVFRATSAAGTWTRNGASVEGESLWEFLHHRDDTLRDHEGNPLTPILIFDQFEEIFTLAQTDDTGRQRAKDFLADLSNLVENRPPASLEARIDRDEVDAAAFDFARADYRVLIALREDYLAHLEGLKTSMPSVTQNRVRLARFTGAQAVTAVRSAAPHLVSEEVAGQIVQFVAGIHDLARAEVEPSLLSLVCRELNNTRLARKQTEITADLLAGSRETILTEFYERALADQKPGVRRFIEDELLTDSGYRESVAEERVRKAFSAAGAPSGSLAELVSRRLLRVEERLDVRRVELTHDVLCSVVMASRSVRHEREARDLAERQLNEQRAREAATRRALVRARAVATICAVVMLIAAGSAVFGWIGLRRARAADAQAEAAKKLAESARGEAENLVGFLLEDFYDELAPTGRVEIIGGLAQRAVTYYDGLPSELRTPLTLRNRGMALVREAAATLQRGDGKGAAPIYAEARQIFDQLRANGDNSEDCAIGYALAYFPDTQSGNSFATDLSSLDKAATVIRPFATKADGSRRAKLVYADILNLQSHRQPPEQGVATCEEARRVLATLGATTVSDLVAAAAYADLGDSEARHALALGRLDQAEKLEKEVDDVADRIIARRPGFLRAMEDRCFAPNVLATISLRRFSTLQALAFAQEAERSVNEYVRFNPSNAWGWAMLASTRRQTAEILFERGKVNDAVAMYRFAADTEHDGRNTTGLSLSVPSAWRAAAVTEALQGRRDRAQADVAEMSRTGKLLLASTGAPDFLTKSATEYTSAVEARLQFVAGEYAAALSGATESLRRADALAAHEMDTLRGPGIAMDLLTIAESGLRLAKLDEAERAVDRLLDSPKGPAAAPQTDDEAQFGLLKAHILVAEGKAGDARVILDPVVAYYRKQQAAGASGFTFRLQLARALLVQSRTTPDGADALKSRKAQLDEASSLLTGLSGEAASLKNTVELKGWIDAAKADLG
ncbi:MAG TPA: hypothetical protein VHD32_03735 [Candidatus Didemnitutus sp.]|nr:hypothetical protein [Candidatus Didemnitutus sp.]